jgi:hypothetical protein
MISFVPFTQALDVLEPIKGKRVCDVIKHRRTRLATVFLKEVPYQTVEWRGSTEDAYFWAEFSNGVIYVDVQEREQQLGNNAHIVGFVKAISVLNDIDFGSGNVDPQDKRYQDKIQQNAQYLLDEYPKDLETISFSDVMRLLEWKLKNKKVKEEEVDWT